MVRITFACNVVSRNFSAYLQPLHLPSPRFHQSTWTEQRIFLEIKKQYLNTLHTVLEFIFAQFCGIPFMSAEMEITINKNQ
jgi:hypothetical protein